MFKNFSLFLAFIFLIACPVQAETIKIFVTNDVNGYIEHIPPAEASNGKGKIGYAYLKGYINEALAQTKFLLDAGAAVNGSIYAKVDYGRSIARLLGWLDYDYVLPGNHEFIFNSPLRKYDYYSDLLAIQRAYQQLATGKTDAELCVSVAQNLLIPPGQTLPNNFVEPLVIYEEEKENGLRIILTGIASAKPETKQNEPYLGGITFGEKEAVLARLAESLKPYNRKKDLVIVLSNLGTTEEKQSLSALDLTKIANIDIICDSDSHQLSFPETINKVTYVNGGSQLEQFIEITVHPDATYQVEIVSYDEALEHPADQQIAKLVQKITQQGSAQQVLGSIPIEADLSNPGMLSCKQSTQLGRFAGKIMQEATGADFAILFGGNLQGEGLIPGTVRKRDIYELVGMLRNTVTIKVTAQELYDLFSQQFAQKDIFQREDYSFLQFSGLQVILTPRPKGGYLVEDITKDGSSLLAQPEKEYVLALSSLFLGGSYPYEFKEENILSLDYPDLAYLITQAFLSGRVNALDWKELERENIIIN